MAICYIRKLMKTILITTVCVLSLLCTLPALAADNAAIKRSLSPIIQKSTNTTIPQELYATIGVCNETSTFEVMKSREAEHGYMPSLYPEAVAGELFPEAKFDVDLQNSIANAPVQIIKQPKHGKLISTVISKDGFIYDHKYMPDAKYQGNDSAEFLVDIDGKKIKITFYFKVVDRTGNKVDKNNVYIKQYCPSPNWWKISFITGAGQ